MPTKPPLVPKAGRQPRKDPQVSITGSGRFKPPGQTKWFKFSGPRHVPFGTQVRYTTAGTAGKASVPKGTLAEIHKGNK